MVVRARVIVKSRDVLKRLGALRTSSPKLVKVATERTAKVIKPDVDRILKHPPRKRKFTRFKTAKQRRYFWGAVGRGEIKLPYKRRGIWKLWDVKVTMWKNGTILTIENPSSIARFVYGPNQQPFLSHWPLLKKNKRDRSGFKAIDKLATKEFEHQYRKVLGEQIIKGKRA